MKNLKTNILSVGVLSLGLVLTVNSHARLRVRTNVNVVTAAEGIKVMPNATALQGTARTSLNRFVTKAEGLTTAEATAANSSPIISEMVSLVEGLVEDESEAGESGLNRDESIELASNIAYSLISSVNAPEDESVVKLANLLKIHILRGNESEALALPGAEDPDGRRLSAEDIQKFVAFFSKLSSEIASGTSYQASLTAAHAQTVTVQGNQVAMFSGTLAELLADCALELATTSLSE